MSNIKMNGSHVPIMYKGKIYSLYGLSNNIHCMVSYETLRKNIVRLRYALREQEERRIEESKGRPPKDVTIILDDKQVDKCMNKDFPTWFDIKFKRCKRLSKIVSKASLDDYELHPLWKMLNKLMRVGSLAHTVRNR